MLKYRRLSDQELSELEQELKQFLIANGVHNEEWVFMNKHKPDQAMHLVDLFSNLVLEKSLGEIKYLIHAAKNDLKVFWFQKQKAHMVALKSSSSALDFTQDNWLSEIPEQYSQVRFFKSEKSFQEEQRSSELHQLIAAGAQVSTEQMFKIVHQLGKK